MSREISVEPAARGRTRGGDGHRSGLRGRVRLGGLPAVRTDALRRFHEQGRVAGAHVVTAIVIGCHTTVTEVHPIVEQLK